MSGGRKHIVGRDALKCNALVDIDYAVHTKSLLPGPFIALSPAAQGTRGARCGLYTDACHVVVVCGTCRAEGFVMGHTSRLSSLEMGLSNASWIQK